ncbi:hypothetical protein [Deinococcus xianganensis]|uniref:Uncharacterized protein n=1 Tax=Deinococcus xianganensis TaxID=1507289 RepID=A0A6I4YUC7_9DEIO|nr:hypothetical protein [Deinococcus xianganensis]MXV21235.1 hypothetical protein [Deinococcus xianganensis]
MPLVDTLPAPGTRYSLCAGNDPRFEVVRVLQEHPEYRVLELRGLSLKRLRVEVLVLRGAASLRPTG